MRVGYCVPRTVNSSPPNRVTHYDRFLNLQGVDHREIVFRETVSRVAGWRDARCAIAAASYPVYVIGLGQLRRKVIKDMRRIAQTRQQHHCPPGTSPIEYFQAHSRRNCDGEHAVRGGITPVRFLRDCSD
jgi:hypothetical protein